MIVELDIGNTRVKWRCLDGHGQRLDGDACLRSEDWLSSARLPLAVDGIRVASVAGGDVDADLSDAVFERWGKRPRFASTATEQGGVCNSYQDPARMGVDRWLAMLAARASCDAPVCIIDCGSAVTIDLVDIGGQHLGGYILPGMTLMSRSLLDATDRVRFDAQGHFGDTAPGTSTAEAVEHGVLLAVCGALEWVLARQPASMKCFLTGGDADRLVPQFERLLVRRPELVMDGLAIALPIE